MGRIAKVTLTWIEKPSDRPLPRAERFSRPARFSHQGEDWKKDAWSLSVVTEEAVDAENRQSATAKFLVDDAPHEWLAVGAQFTLFEGAFALADGVVDDILSS
jgi:hypothetical protein